MVTLERVKDKRLVRLGDMYVREPPFVREVHLGRDRTRVETGRLRVELQVHGFGRLDTEDELVTRDVLEDALCNVLELDPDLDLGFVQS